MHALIQNGTVVEYPIVNLRYRLPNYSLPGDLTNNELLPEGFVFVETDPQPEYNSLTHRLQLVDLPVFDSNRWKVYYEVIPLTDTEVSQKLNLEAQNIRYQRNQKLQECDWTQAADAPVDKALWATYRQALRDITAQPGFPTEVVWPTPP